jgi:hypothetical protein
MAKLTGGIAALVALFAGLFAKVEPDLCLERATLAFLLGWVCGQVWQLLIGAANAGAANAEKVRFNSHSSEPFPDHPGE